MSSYFDSNSYNRSDFSNKIIDLANGHLIIKKSNLDSVNGVQYFFTKCLEFFGWTSDLTDSKIIEAGVIAFIEKNIYLIKNDDVTNIQLIINKILKLNKNEKHTHLEKLMQKISKLTSQVHQDNFPVVPPNSTSLAPNFSVLRNFIIENYRDLARFQKITDVWIPEKKLESSEEFRREQIKKVFQAKGNRNLSVKKNIQVQTQTENPPKQQLETPQEVPRQVSVKKEESPSGDIDPVITTQPDDSFQEQHFDQNEALITSTKELDEFLLGTQEKASKESLEPEQQNIKDTGRDHESLLKIPEKTTEQDLEEYAIRNVLEAFEQASQELIKEFEFQNREEVDQPLLVEQGKAPEPTLADFINTAESSQRMPESSGDDFLKHEEAHREILPPMVESAPKSIEEARIPSANEKPSRIKKVTRRPRGNIVTTIAKMLFLGPSLFAGTSGWALHVPTPTLPSQALMEKNFDLPLSKERPIGSLFEESTWKSFSDELELDLNFEGDFPEEEELDLNPEQVDLGNTQDLPTENTFNGKVIQNNSIPITENQDSQDAEVPIELDEGEDKPKDLHTQQLIGQDKEGQTQLENKGGTGKTYELGMCDLSDQKIINLSQLFVASPAVDLNQSDPKINLLVDGLSKLLNLAERCVVTATGALGVMWVMNRLTGKEEPLDRVDSMPLLESQSLPPVVLEGITEEESRRIIQETGNVLASIKSELTTTGKEPLPSKTGKEPLPSKTGKEPLPSKKGKRRLVREGQRMKTHLKRNIYSFVDASSNLKRNKNFILSFIKTRETLEEKKKAAVILCSYCDEKLLKDEKFMVNLLEDAQINIETLIFDLASPEMKIELDSLEKTARIKILKDLSFSELFHRELDGRDSFEPDALEP